MFLWIAVSASEYTHKFLFECKNYYFICLCSMTKQISASQNTIFLKKKFLWNALLRVDALNVPFMRSISCVHQGHATS